MKKEHSLRAHLISILLLPFNVTIIIPSLLVYFSGLNLTWGLSFPYNILFYALGIFSVIFGLVIVISTIVQFAKKGRGTLAPWNPPQTLVVTGLDRHTRNPMISGVVFILFGEVLMIGSWILLLWLVLFAVGNYIYFILVEEPKLKEKFGVAYLKYKKNVPRLLPRINSWSQKNIKRK